jgi:hypothetical protein
MMNNLKSYRRRAVTLSGVLALTWNFRRLIAIAVPVLGLAGSALANDSRLAGIAIPASSCTPSGPDDDARLRLDNGAWVLVSGATGTATLQCPVLVAPNGNGPVGMTSYRVYFRDPSSTGVCTDSPSSVSVGLRYRNSTAAGFFNAGPSWNSDCGTGACNPANFCIIHTDEFDRREVPLVHDIANNRLYHFFVRLTRENANDPSPAFAGIDFAP